MEQFLLWIKTNKEWLFSGLGITLLAVGFYSVKLLIKKFNNQNALIITLERTVIKLYRYSDFFAQINFTVSSKDFPVSLKRIYLKYNYSSNHSYDESQGSLYSRNGMLLEQLFPFDESDHLSKNESDLISYIHDAQTTLIPIRDKTIPTNSNLSLTYLGLLSPPTFMGDVEDFDLNNWKLFIEYGDSETKTLDFSFRIHKTSRKSCSQYTYDGVKGRVIYNHTNDFG